jgi:hypothetical protein
MPLFVYGLTGPLLVGQCSESVVLKDHAMNKQESFCNEQYILLGLGTGFFLWKSIIVFGLEHIGFGDSAAYATMAASVLEGKGFSVGYISSFFIPYESITRPEDHWPPLYSVLILPAFAILGESAFAAKVPNMLVSCYLLPFAALLLTRELRGNSSACLASGLTVLSLPIVFEESLKAMADISFSAFFLLLVVYFLRGVNQQGENRSGWAFVIMGLCFGIAYYGKGLQIIFFPVIIVAYFWTKKRWRLTREDMVFVVGLLVAIGMMLPWWWRNLSYFGDPFFSTQSFMSGLQGYGEGNGLFIYWNHEFKPSLFTTKIPLGWSCVIDKTLIHIGDYLKLIFWQAPPQSSHGGQKLWLTGIPVGVFGAIFLLGSIFRRSHRSEIIVQLFLVCGIGFLSVFWSPISRLALPFIILVIAAAWAKLGYINGAREIFNRGRIKDLEHPAKRCLRTRVILASMIIVFSVNTIADIQYWKGGVARKEYPYADSLEVQNRLMLANWIKRNTESGAVIMDYEPWDLHFHSKRQTVAVPYDSLERVGQIMETYKVTHLTYYSPKYLIPLFDDRLIGFSRLVYYPHAYGKYIDSYPDLKKYATKKISDGVNSSNNSRSIDAQSIDQLGYDHFIRHGSHEGRSIPEIEQEDIKDGLVLWELTGGPSTVTVWPKTNDIRWLFDICR